MITGQEKKSSLRIGRWELADASATLALRASEFIHFIGLLTSTGHGGVCHDGDDWLRSDRWEFATRDVHENMAN